LARTISLQTNCQQLENISEQFLLFAESKAFRSQPMTMEELSFRLNTLLTANDYPVLYEYKEFLRPKANAHALETFGQYNKQLKSPAPETYEETDDGGS